MLLVKQLVLALVKAVEFSFDNADARCTGYNRCRLRIRFYMIVYLGNRLFYFCTVRWHKTGLQQSRNWRNSWVRISRHAEINVKIGPHLAYISVFSILLVFSSVLRFLDCFPVLVLLPYGYSHSDALSFLIFWVLVSEPLSATFSHLIEVMYHGKLNFFDVLDKYECWKGKCVKPVLGWFCSGVSICRNKGPQADMVFLTLFNHGP